MSYKYEFCVVHCTATPEGRDVPIDVLDSWFKAKPPKGRGWSKPGYRTVIDRYGKAHDMIDYDNDQVLEWDEVTYGAKGFNTKSIHISYIGGVDEMMQAKDTRTEAQWLALEYHMKVILSYHPDIKFIGHNQISAKACPSFDVIDFCKSICVPNKNIGYMPAQIIDAGVEDVFDFPVGTVEEYFGISNI